MRGGGAGGGRKSPWSLVRKELEGYNENRRICTISQSMKRLNYVW